MNIDEYKASQNGGAPDADISKIDFSKAIEETEEDTPAETPVVTEPVKTEETKTDENVKVDNEPPKTEESAKKVQTPEENAKFAEQRRQQQVEKRVQEELEKLKSSDPAFKLAQTMEKMYGLPIDQVHQRIQEAMIIEEAKVRNVPVEVVRAEHATQQQTAQVQVQATQAMDQLTEANFKLWEIRMNNEASKIKQDLPMLTDEDFTTAQEYMLLTLKNAELPLEHAVNMLHGSKIRQALAEIAKNDALAKVSGRTPDALPPVTGKQKAASTLTDDEKYVAKHIFKMTEDEYIKHRSSN